MAYCLKCDKYVHAPVCSSCRAELIRLEGVKWQDHMEQEIKRAKVHAFADGFEKGHSAGRKDGLQEKVDEKAILERGNSAWHRHYEKRIKERYEEGFALGYKRGTEKGELSCKVK